MSGEPQVQKIGYIMSFPLEVLYPPKGHAVYTLKTSEWLEERRLFITRWEALRDEGIEKDFLEYEGCYECRGELAPTTHTEDSEWFRDEPTSKDES